MHYKIIAFLIYLININLKYKKYKKEYRKARISCKEFKIKISKLVIKIIL